MEQRALAVAAAIILTILALPVVIIMGMISAHHEDSVYYASIPNAYVGQWKGSVTPIQDPTGVDTSVSGPVAVSIPKGLSESNNDPVNNGGPGLADVMGPGISCAEYWTISDIENNSVTFETVRVVGSEASCGSDAQVVVTTNGKGRVSATWEDGFGTVLGKAVLSHP
jgi:hypothetical protein